jgi:hypothetical protein
LIGTFFTVEYIQAQLAQKKAASASTFDRSVLQNVRVMQRNLVYVIGLPPSIAKDDILRRREHFGRFGRIVKVAVNRKQVHSTSNSLASYSAYITVGFFASVSLLNSLFNASVAVQTESGCFCGNPGVEWRVHGRACYSRYIWDNEILFILLEKHCLQQSELSLSSFSSSG